MCHPDVQNGYGYLRAYDAEQAWFVRVDHIDRYGTDPHLEELTVHPPEPLMFLNLRGVPDATCLIWEHTEDAPGRPCPNPRVILPRRFVPNVLNETVEVMIRNFGVRTSAMHGRMSHLRHHGVFAHPAPSLGLALAVDRSSRPCQSQHHGQRRAWPAKAWDRTGPLPPAVSSITRTCCCSGRFNRHPRFVIP